MEFVALSVNEEDDELLEINDSDTLLRKIELTFGNNSIINFNTSISNESSNNNSEFFKYLKELPSDIKRSIILILLGNSATSCFEYSQTIQSDYNILISPTVFSPNGTQLLVPSFPKKSHIALNNPCLGNIDVFDLKSSKMLFRYSFPEKILHMSTSYDGKYIILTFLSLKLVRIVDIETREDITSKDVLYTKKDYKFPIFNKEGNILYARKDFCSDNIKFWDSKTGFLIKNLEYPSLFFIDYSVNNDIILLKFDDKSILLSSKGLGKNSYINRLDENDPTWKFFTKLYPLFYLTEKENILGNSQVIEKKTSFLSQILRKDQSRDGEEDDNGDNNIFIEFEESIVDDSIFKEFTIDVFRCLRKFWICILVLLIPAFILLIVLTYFKLKSNYVGV